MPDKRKNIMVGLDGLRIFAALIVMFYHLTYLVSVPGHTPFRLTHGSLHFPGLSQITRHGWIGVEIFFLISGFVISMSAERATATRFAIGRVLRLVPTVWICAPITFVAAYFAADGSLFHLATRLIRSLLFIPVGSTIDGSYWTLGIEISFYICIFCAIKFRAWHKVHILLYALAAASLVFNAMRFWGPLPPNFNNRMLDLLLLSYGGLFALGGLIYKIKFDGPNIQKMAFAGVALLSSILCIICQTRLDEGHSTDLVPCAIFLCGLVLFCLSVAFNAQISHALSPWTDPIRQAGMATYPLYLLHQLLGSAILGALTARGLSPLLALGLTVAAIFLIVFAVTQIEPYLRKAMKQAIEQLENQSRRLRKQPTDII